MADLSMLDKAFHDIMQSFIETGRAPHYAELAAALGVTVEEGRQLLHDLEATGYSFFLHPETDQIVLFVCLITCLTNTAFPSMGGKNGWRKRGIEALGGPLALPRKTVRMTRPSGLRKTHGYRDARRGGSDGRA